MKNFMPKKEINEIGEGLIKVYMEQTVGVHQERVDIEDFITAYLGLKIQYAYFGDVDKSKIGFLADGQTPLLIVVDGEIHSCVFPKRTIVIEKSLKKEVDQGRCRFTLAHEAAHHILNSMKAAESELQTEEECEHTKEELIQLMEAEERRADIMAAALLMPKFIVEQALIEKAGVSKLIIYGENTFGNKEKQIIGKLTNTLGVSRTALFIRLKNLDLLEHRSMSEFIISELQLGGVKQ